MDGRMPLAVLLVIAAGGVGGLALGAFATGPAYSSEPMPEFQASISAPASPEYVLPAPPVRKARYSGRLVVCTGCANPVWQPQAAVPVRYTLPDEPALEEAPPASDPPEEPVDSVQDASPGVAVIVGSRARSAS